MIAHTRTSNHTQARLTDIPLGDIFKFSFNFHKNSFTSTGIGKLNFKHTDELSFNIRLSFRATPSWLNRMIEDILYNPILIARAEQDRSFEKLEPKWSNFKFSSSSERSRSYYEALRGSLNRNFLVHRPPRDHQNSLPDSRLSLPIELGDVVSARYRFAPCAWNPRGRLNVRGRRVSGVCLSTELLVNKAHLLETRISWFRYVNVNYGSGKNK